ncbi:pre-mRNA-splicing factor cwc22 [Ceratobasidium sp. 370]|nr:pre-mRNA-splicing factor cwc22 [Ceratobasidium sp. 370]
MSDMEVENYDGDSKPKRKRELSKSRSRSPTPKRSSSPPRARQRRSPSPKLSAHPRDGEVPKVLDVDPERRKERERQLALRLAEIELDAAPPKPAFDAQAEFAKLLSSRSGGVYVPPARLRALQAAASEDKSSAEYQRLSWDALRKSITGIVNRVNIANIKHVIPELFGENLVRGRGLFARSLMKAQAASLPFTPIFAALVAVINTKLPQIVCHSTTTFIAHLVNQGVAHEIIALQILVLLLEQPTDDSVEIAVGFMREVGAYLAENSPRANNGVFERFRAVLHEGAIDKRVQYMIEVLFQVRKDKYKDNVIIPEGLDLVEEDDQITHQISLDDELQVQEGLNIYKFDPNFLENEEKYKEIKAEILGEGSDDEDESGSSDSDSEGEGGAVADKPGIEDMTETNLVNLRRTIYLTIMNALSYEEAVHKLMKVNIQEGQEIELCNMIVECCSQERSYSSFYGLIGERFCKLNRVWCESFEEAFATYFDTIHRYETNRLRNIARFFGHLLANDGISWAVFSVVKVNEEDTTSSSRIFIKILMQELQESMGLKTMTERFKDPTMRESFAGMFPMDDPTGKSTRFAVNYFTALGLGVLTEDMRTNLLENARKMAAIPTPAQTLQIRTRSLILMNPEMRVEVVHDLGLPGEATSHRLVPLPGEYPRAVEGTRHHFVVGEGQRLRGAGVALLLRCHAPVPRRLLHPHVGPGETIRPRARVVETIRLHAVVETRRLLGETIRRRAAITLPHVAGMIHHPGDRDATIRRQHAGRPETTHPRAVVRRALIRLLNVVVGVLVEIALVAASLRLIGLVMSLRVHANDENHLGHLVAAGVIHHPTVDMRTRRVAATTLRPAGLVRLLPAVHVMIHRAVAKIRPLNMPPKRAKKTPAGAGAGGAASGAAASAPPPSHVSTIGVKRPGYGKTGRPTTVVVNHFVCTIPTGIIYHYDEIGGDRALPARANVETMKTLQERLEPNLFSPKGAYDGRKNLFTTKRLALGDNNTRTLPMGNPRPDSDRPPRTRRIKIQLAQEINPEVLSQFQQGRHAQDNVVLTALMALNVALRHEPISKYTFNTRSFFLPTGKKQVPMGLELWPGVFQSIRPAVNSMHINIDTSTGVVFKPGPVVEHALAFLGRNQPADLSLRGRLNTRDLRSLQSRLKSLRIAITYLDGKKPEKSIQGLTDTGASNTMFESNGQMISVAQYFQSTYRKTVRYPEIPCIKVSSKAVIPMEFCEILPGQLMRKQIPTELTDEMVNFSRKRPEERLAAIKAALPITSQAATVTQFGITVDPNPVKCPARILESPNVMYDKPVKPRNGAWNLRGERLKNPAQVKGWVLVIFERQNFFDQGAAQQTVERLKRACEEKGENHWIGPQALDRMGARTRRRCKDSWRPGGTFQTIMPKASGDLYPAVKRFGDVTAGVATQCLKAAKCRGGNPQYFGNVCLKINVKLGGINAVLPPDPTVRFLGDPSNPTLVLGADVAHPAPGTEGRPSFTALVGSVDSLGSKYVATHRAQTSRVEVIADLEDMAVHIIKLFQGYQKAVEKKATPGPKRILFYRDGVSEGQFKAVLEQELPALQRACVKCDLKPMPKITLVIVGKRHHTRMFPEDPKTAFDQKSGNCEAGTVIDSIIGHPLEFDFFLLSHGGLIGTSRPAHYSVVHDDNNFTPDSLQKLTYQLCHVYARATRSVSIPPPVYYADIVCGRAKHHLPAGAEYDLSDSMTVASTDAEDTLNRIRAAYRPTHPNLEKNMYFQ